MFITSNIVYEASIETAFLDNNLNPITTLSSGQNGFPKTNGFINLIIGGSLKVKSNFTINNNTISLENGSMTIPNFNQPANSLPEQFVSIMESPSLILMENGKKWRTRY